MEQRLSLPLLADVLKFRILAGLPAPSLVAVAHTCRELALAVGNDASLWKSLALHILGQGLCALHETSAKPPLPSDDAAAAWWRDLVCATASGKRIQKSLHFSGAKNLLRICGHVAVSVGEVVLLIGGFRPKSNARDGDVIVCDLRTRNVRLAELAPGSEAPPSRMRHAACVISPDETSDVHLPRVLVLGGVSHEFRDHGRVMHTSSEALILELMDSQANQVRWRRQPLSGEGPGADGQIFHEMLCATNGGRRVLCFGGDSIHFEDELEYLAAKDECVERAESVFELDLHTWSWQRRRTSGDRPGHRSLPEGTVYNNCLVVLGGTADPKPASYGHYGRLAAMTPYTLDLDTWVWQKHIHAGMPEPLPRARSSSERWGDHLLCVGGRGERGDMYKEFHQLDLRTMRWCKPCVEESSVPVCAGSMNSGLIVGGFLPPFDAADRSDALLFEMKPNLLRAPKLKGLPFFLKSWTLANFGSGGMRNDFHGDVGFRFVPAIDVVVTALGRQVLFLKLKRSARVSLWCADIEAALVTVAVGPRSVVEGGYAFVALKDKIILQAGKEYRLSQECESAMPDFWFDGVAMPEELNQYVASQLAEFKGSAYNTGFGYPATVDDDARWPAEHRRAGMFNIKMMPQSKMGLFRGVYVRVSGLVKRADLNGSQGVLTKYHEDSGRWAVVVLPLGTVAREGILVQPKNLECLTGH